MGKLDNETAASVFRVAEWFLHKKSFTHKQLQKLCYYAQAWHCALVGRSLFAEEFQAWVHGPVCPKLNSEYADYGWRTINRRRGSSPKFPAETLQVLKAVYNTYAKFDGEQLEALTHSEAPWGNARGDLKPFEPCTDEITLESMSAYYRSLIQSPRQI